MAMACIERYGWGQLDEPEEHEDFCDLAEMGVEVIPAHRGAHKLSRRGPTHYQKNRKM